MRAFVALPTVLLLAASAQAQPQDHPDIRLFFQAATQDDGQAETAMAALAETWRDDYAAMIVDLARFMMPRRRAAWSGPDSFDDPPGGQGPFAGAGTEGRGGGGSRGGGGFPSPTPQRPEDPTTRVRERLIDFLEERTDRSFGGDLPKWRQWYWNRPYAPHPDYALFKAALYGRVDPDMVDFFNRGGKALIRLDEIEWGGVGVDGIPPLDHPKHVKADEADYLEDENVVFGIAVGGEARAYPKRILAWHEMARDRIGGVELAIVYCTLCGTVIPYGAEAGGEHYTIGTSGLLYRSNKLMYDNETKSLWSTVEGKPVIGPLAGLGIELPTYPVVTTTWREWSALHPDTTVLSLETGHERDYSEGAAYRDYFRHDRLMFAVPATDDRLKNKAEVLALALRAPGDNPDAERHALAVSARFLRKKEHRIFHRRFAGRELVVLTSDDGANRVYDAGDVRFARLSGARAVDSGGGEWRLTEEALVPLAGGEPRPRVPARRAFWFGWYAQYPETELVD